MFFVVVNYKLFKEFRKKWSIIKNGDKIVKIFTTRR